MKVAVFDTKPYDKEYLQAGPGSEGVDWQFHEFRLSAETAAAARGCEAVCAFVNDRIDDACLDALAGLGVGLVALRCAGFNNIDLPAAKKLGLNVTRVPDYSPHAVAEHTVALLLALNRKIHRAFNRVREFNFSLNGLVGFDLHGKTAGIVGTGKIGKLVAKILNGFGCRVVAYDPVQSDDWAEASQVAYVPFERLIDEADIISLHLPLTRETYHLLNADNLHRLKAGAYLVNTSRGKLIDTTVLIQTLKAGHLGGVALDVYEEEEGIFFEDHSHHVLQDDELTRLMTFHNVLVTSHQAFLTREALGEIARVTVTNLLHFAQGQPLLQGTEL